jgi:hypothetical protein
MTCTTLAAVKVDKQAVTFFYCWQSWSKKYISVRSQTSTGAESLEYVTWFKLPIQHIPSVADRSINVQNCDVTVTLDVGLVPCSEDVPFEGIFSWCQVWSRFVCCWGQEISHLVQRRTVSCFYSIQAEDKQTCRRDMYQHLLMSNVAKDDVPFPTRSCSFRYELLVLWHSVSTCDVGRFSQNLAPCSATMEFTGM